MIDYIYISIGQNNPLVVYEDYRDDKSLRIKEEVNFIVDKLNTDIRLNIIDVFGNISIKKIELMTK